MRARWPVDTIARWFAINIVIAIVVSVCLNAIFIQVAGVWAKPSVAEVGLVEQATAIVRVLGAAPARLRPALAAAGSDEFYHVDWYPSDVSLPVPTGESVEMDGIVDRIRYLFGMPRHLENITNKIRRLIGRPHARVMVSEPAHASPQDRSESDYVLAIDLPDGSWVGFTTLKRIWGLGTLAREGLIALFVLASSLAVASIASRRLARPMKRFSRAAERFGTDVRAPPMKRVGPVEFRAAVDAFNDMQASIQRFVTDRTEMLAAISHDLRAPLTRMRLRGEFIDDAEQQRKLFRDVDEMQAMVNSALSFFRDDSEHEAPTRFDISELVNTVLDDFRDAKRRVSFDSPPNQVYFGRPLALRRAISNLVDNAIKYGNSAAVSLRVMENHIQLRIDDQGKGIPEELHETVFRPFFRIEPSRNRHTGGVGLGLSAARSIVRGHGGEIALANRSPNGLRVTLSLPLHIEANARLGHGVAC
jgi:signal transduction histidine kinase